MNCTRCGREIDNDSAFCRFCGTRASAAPPLFAERRLVRRPEEGRIAGVCAGLADYFNTDVALVRVLWVILSVVPGCIVGGIIAYCVAWVIIPPTLLPGPPPVATRRLVRSRTDRQIAGVCGGLAAYAGIDSTMMRLIWVVLSIVPGAIVLGIVVYVLAWAIMPEEESVPFRPATPVP